MPINNDSVDFDPTDPDSSESVGAYVRSSDGTLITHTADTAATKQRLDVQTKEELNMSANIKYMNSQLHEIVRQLKIMNNHLCKITDTDEEDQEFERGV